MPKKTEPIYTDEWMAELTRLSSLNDVGLTVDEWAEKVGVSTATIRRRLKQARSLGLLVVGRRTVSGIDSRRIPVPVYLIKKPAKK